MISVIIPTHNDSDLLLKTVASCFVQDVPVEVVVVDDCSDQCLNYWMEAVICNLCRYVRLDKNVGLAQARDCGIKASRYNYTLPLDTGDWLYPHVLGDMLSAIIDADVVFGNMDEIDGGVVYRPDGEHGVTKAGMMKCNQLWATSLFRKSVWEKVGGYENGLQTSYEDYAFWNKIIRAGGGFKYIDRLIYRHTHNPKSMLSKLHENTDYYKELARKPLCDE